MTLSYRGAAHVKDNHKVYTSEIFILHKVYTSEIFRVYDTTSQTLCEKFVTFREIQNI